MGLDSASPVPGPTSGDPSSGGTRLPSLNARQAKIVFVRFHVQRLASDAVDQVRPAFVRDEQDPERKRAIKGSRFTLLRSKWNLTVEDCAKISEIQRSNRSLYPAYPPFTTHLGFRRNIFRTIL